VDIGLAWGRGRAAGLDRIGLYRRSAVAPVVGSVVGSAVGTIVGSVIGSTIAHWPRCGPRARLVVRTCILAWALIGAGALVLAWVPARALTRVAAEVRTAWSAAIASIIASAVSLKISSVIALAALWPVTPGRWPRPVVDRPRRRFGGFQPGLGQQRRQGLGLHALERAEVGHCQRGAVEVAQQGQPGLALLLVPCLVGLQRRLLDPQLGLLGAQLGLLSP